MTAAIPKTTPAAAAIPGAARCPGEAAYEAFVRKLHDARGTTTTNGQKVPPSSWEKLPALSRLAWLEAADAARAWEKRT